MKFIRTLVLMVASSVIVVACNPGQVGGADSPGMSGCLASLTQAQCSCLMQNMTERDFEYFGRVNAITERDDISHDVKQAQIFSTLSELGSEAATQMAFMASIEAATQACEVSLDDDAQSEPNSPTVPPVSPPSSPSASDPPPNLNLAGRFPDCGADRAWIGDYGACRPISDMYPDRSADVIGSPVWTAQPSGQDIAFHYPRDARGALSRPIRVILSCIVDGRGVLACSVAYVGGAPNNDLNLAFQRASLRLAQSYTMAAQLEDGSSTSGRDYWLNIVWEPQ